MASRLGPSKPVDLRIGLHKDLPAAKGSARLVWLLLAAGFALLLSLAALKYSDHPVGWVATCWVGFFSVGLLFGRNVAFRVLCVNGVFVSFGVGSSELILLHREKVAASGHHYEGGMPVRNDWLGLAPAPSTVTHAWQTAGDKLVYDVHFTHDSLGLRVTPAPAEQPKGAVLFFGCSYVYGEGLNDEATLPFQASTASDRRYRIVNFGYGGYGAHQMLSALEHGLVEKVVGRDPVRYAIYVAIPEHVLRAVGRVAFQRHAPRYRLAPDGSVYFAGHFDDRAAGWRGRVYRALQKSALYRFWAYEVRRRRGFTDADLQLYLGIVARSRDVLRTKYPGVGFRVMLWGDGSGLGRGLDQPIANGLARLGIAVARVPDILPGYDGYIGGSRYRLSAGDAHPDSVANAILARYMVTHVFK